MRYRDKQKIKFSTPHTSAHHHHHFLLLIYHHHQPRRCCCCSPAEAVLGALFESIRGEYDHHYRLGDVVFCYCKGWGPGRRGGEGDDAKITKRRGVAGFSGQGVYLC